MVSFVGVKWEEKWDTLIKLGQISFLGKISMNIMAKKQTQMEPWKFSVFQTPSELLLRKNRFKYFI